MSGARVVVFGYADVGHACLSLLLDRGLDVVTVYTHADAPGETIWFPSVAELARQHGIPVRIAPELGDPTELRALQELRPDVLFSFYYRQLLPRPVIALPRLGAYNVHGSLLPRYRGRAPVNWAVLHGETETGATLHVMTERADAGDIVGAEAVPIGPDDTAADVQARICRAAVRVLGAALEPILRGCPPRRPQDPALATTFGRRRPEDGRIDWSRPAAEVHNLVRAVSHPYPGAFGRLLGATTMIWRTRLAAGGAGGCAPGVGWLEGDRLYVACGGDSRLEIVRAQPPGEPETSGADLARRAARAPAAGPSAP